MYLTKCVFTLKKRRNNKKKPIAILCAQEYIESVIIDGEALSISFEGDAFEIRKDNIIYIYFE